METDGPQRWGSEPESERERGAAPAAGGEEPTLEWGAAPDPSSTSPGGPAAGGRPGGPGPRRGGREPWPLRKKFVVWGCIALAAVVLLAGAGLTVLWNHLNGNIRTQDANLKATPMNGKQDVLFIGSDSRSGANQALGGGAVSGARSDTAMVFDSPADRRKGTEVSIPRDSMVQIPECAGTNGQTVAATFGMFNSAFANGGAPCSVRTVESLTGLPLTHYLVVDFEGVVGVVDALGGVKVCVTQAIDDPDSGLNIPAGTTTLNGQQALAFVRVRHSIGNGSDLQRIQRQQYFLDQLSAQVRADGLLADPIKLYKVLNAATSAIQTDPGLGSVSDLYGLAQTLNSIPSGKMSYVTVPNEPYPADPNRVVWSEPAATTLWDSLINEPDSAPASPTDNALGLRSGPGAATSGPQDVPVRVPAPTATTDAERSAAETLGTFESLMRLALMADTPSDTPSASSNSAAGSTDPGGVDTCAVD